MSTVSGVLTSTEGCHSTFGGVEIYLGVVPETITIFSVPRDLIKSGIAGLLSVNQTHRVRHVTLSRALIAGNVNLQSSLPDC